MKELYLIRGVPGCGKTTFAKSICCVVFSADDYFTVDGVYTFDHDKIGDAHRYCGDCVRGAMDVGVQKIAVANTFTKEWEIEGYFQLADVYDYTVHTIIVENSHGGMNDHGVPEDKVQEMRERFEVKL